MEAPPESKQRFVTPPLAWSFEIEPLHSLDFHPQRPELAVAGADSSGEAVYLRVWSLRPERLFLAEGGKPELKSEMQLGHSKSVNAVRFSPGGSLLATGGDDTKVVVWEERERPRCFGSAETVFSWAESRVLAGHSSEVYHVAWFADGQRLASGSHDFSVIVWDVRRARMEQRLDGPAGYVKFVAVDPLAKFLAALSCDRTLRLYKAQKQRKQLFSIKHSVRRKQPAGAEDAKEEPDQCWFLPDSTGESIFIRGDWAPDGSLLCVPRGQLAGEDAARCGALLFSRADLRSPALFYPCDKPVNLVRFCPAFFPAGPVRAFDSPFEFFLALATYDALVLHSTARPAPLWRLQHIHYASLTDLAWLDADAVAVCSMDGFVTFVSAQLPARPLPRQARPPAAPDPEPDRPPTLVPQKVLFRDGKKTIIPQYFGK